MKKVLCIAALALALCLALNGCGKNNDDAYQGLTKEEWEELQEQKERFEALSDEGRQAALEGGTVGCRKFIHQWWEESISVELIRLVGEEQFHEWIKERQADDKCADIYSFAAHFGLDLETLMAFIRDNNLTEIYPTDKLETRYAFMGVR